MITDNMKDLDLQSLKEINFHCGKCGSIILKTKSDSPIELHTFNVSGEVDYIINHKKCLEKIRGQLK